MKRPAILIVTYNSQDTIGPCLEAAVQQDADVLVVDNASGDETVSLVRRHPEVALVASETNLGFAGAVNRGMSVLHSELVLLLNPDAVLLSGLDALVEAFRDPRVAAAAGKLVDEDSKPQTGFSVRRFPTPASLAFEALGWNRLWRSNPVNRRYRCLDLDLERPAEVEQPAGAFLMLRRKVWRSLGGMDEEFYPLWFEEVDFLYRLRKQGHLIRYEPSAVARHGGGDSVRRLSAGCRQLYWYGSLLRYASKHFGRLGRSVVCVAVVFGSLLRMLTGIVVERSLKPILVYGKVIQLALRSVLSGRVRTTGGFAAARMTG